LDIIISVILGQLKNTKDAFQTDETVCEHAKTFNIYGSKLCKYLLGILENANSKEKINIDSAAVTLEHILPRNANSAAWQKALGSKFDNVYSTYLHTIGNMTLTGYNSEMSDKSFEEKKAELSKLRSKIAFLNFDIIESAVWDGDSILNRTKRLIDASNNFFRFPVWSGTNYHKTEGEIKITLDNSDSVTGKKVLRYDFMGEVVQINKFYEALVGVIKKVYDDEELLLHDWALNNKFGFSFQKEKLLKPFNIEGTDIYMEINMNAAQILLRIKKILDELNVSHDEFCLICK